MLMTCQQVAAIPTKRVPPPETRFLERDEITQPLHDLAGEKTRLIEFGRFAAARRRARGLGKPQTFDFLGFTHICGRDRKGRVALRRRTCRKRLHAKLRAIKDELKHRRYLPVPEQGQWLARVLQGHYNYYAVPGNIAALEVFRRQVIRHWYEALRRRSQRTRLTWERMRDLETRWLPPARIMHPWPSTRFAVRTRAKSPVR